MIPQLLPMSPVCTLLESLAEVMGELAALPQDRPGLVGASLILEAEHIALELSEAMSRTPPAFIAADVALFVRRVLEAWEAAAVLDGPASPVETPPPGYFDMAASEFRDQFPG